MKWTSVSPCVAAADADVDGETEADVTTVEPDVVVPKKTAAAAAAAAVKAPKLPRKLGPGVKAGRLLRATAQPTLNILLFLLVSV